MSEQLFFDGLFNNFKIKNHIRLIELFAGVGSQAMALRDIGADFEHWKVIEFDKYAVASYNAIHGTKFEPADIKNIKGQDLQIVDTDLHTYILISMPGFEPCGKAKGNEKGFRNSLRAVVGS